MSLSQIYWLITLPKIGEIVGTLLLIIGSTLLFLIVIIYVASEFDKDVGKYFKKYIGWVIITILVGGILNIFIPSTKEIVAIYGIHYATTNQQITQIPPKLLELANIKLDDLLETAKK